MTLVSDVSESSWLQYRGFNELCSCTTITISKSNKRIQTKTYAQSQIVCLVQDGSHRWILGFHQVPWGYNTMTDGGQIMRFKLDSNEILLFIWPPCALNWNLMKATNSISYIRQSNFDLHLFKILNDGLMCGFVWLWGCVPFSCDAKALIFATCALPRVCVVSCRVTNVIYIA